MKRSRNSDSKTHVKKQNPTSRTEISRQSLKYLFLETPCIFHNIPLSSQKLHLRWMQHRGAVSGMDGMGMDGWGEV